MFLLGVQRLTPQGVRKCAAYAATTLDAALHFVPAARGDFLVPFSAKVEDLAHESSGFNLLTVFKVFN